MGDYQRAVEPLPQSLECTDPSVETIQCRGNCGRQLPWTCKWFEPTGTRRADGTMYLRRECYWCRGSYTRRLKLRDSLIKYHSRLGADSKRLMAIKSVGKFAEAMLSLASDLRKDGLSLREWFELGIDSRSWTRDVASREVVRMLTLHARCNIVTEDYLLLLGGDEPFPRPADEKFELLSEVLDDVKE